MPYWCLFSTNPWDILGAPGSTMDRSLIRLGSLGYTWETSSRRSMRHHFEETMMRPWGPGWNMVKHLQLPWWIRFLTSQVVMLWYVMGVGRVFWLKSWDTYIYIYNIYRMWCWFSTMKNRRGDPDHPCSPYLYLFIYISRTRSAKRSGKDRLFLPCRWRIPLGAISAMEFSWPSRESPEHPTMMFFAMTQVVLVPHGFTWFYQIPSHQLTQIDSTKGGLEDYFVVEKDDCQGLCKLEGHYTSQNVSNAIRQYSTWY